MAKEEIKNEEKVLVEYEIVHSKTIVPKLINENIAEKIKGMKEIKSMFKKKGPISH